ncbi:hypothetical protein CH339_15470 [Rhodobium orientis]|uniref:Uncharacterized protein n=1 Tax=Rhodobium orientis TaxID=34017 RepID=A0A327JL75_9HYPH|nr:hypothetical protein [Rhodobium orientis]RAI26063.1 hypothetical protein CH339_15470 [Rhodobium orientis]
MPSRTNHKSIIENDKYISLILVSKNILDYFFFDGRPKGCKCFVIIDKAPRLFLQCAWIIHHDTIFMIRPWRNWPASMEGAYRTRVNRLSEILDDEFNIFIQHRLSNAKPFGVIPANFLISKSLKITDAALV